MNIKLNFNIIFANQAAEAKDESEVAARPAESLTQPPPPRRSMLEESDDEDESEEEEVTIQICLGFYTLSLFVNNVNNFVLIRRGS